MYEFSGRRPSHSINFITSHDGYTLNDLVSYEQKHNQANGEDNRDGDNNNYSANNGVEGPTRRRLIVQLRRRQTKNMIASLLLSHGTPMVVAGDEVLRTQRGNNNAYCQDNALSWFDWKLVEKNAEMLRFVQTLISFRKAQPNVRRDSFLTGKPKHADQLADVNWFSPDGKRMDWHKPTQSLTCIFGTEGLDDPAAKAVMLLMHPGTDTQDYKIPDIARQLPWKLFIDTSAKAPHDIYPAVDGPPLPDDGSISLIHHTLMCYVA